MTLPEAEALAESRLSAGDWAGAAEVYRSILEAVPGHPTSLMGLGVSLCQAGSYGEGAPLLLKAALARPLDAEAQNNAGNALRVVGALDEAEGLLRRSIALDPSRASAWANLSALQRDRGAFAAALASADEALMRDPGFAPARLNRGTALQSLGRLEEAVEELKLAVEAAPRFLPAWNALLLFLQYSERHDAASIADWTRSFGRLFPAPPRSAPPKAVRRIGWIGGDFREHPVGRCVASFSAELPGHGFECIFYANQPDEDADSITAQIAESGEWRSLWGRSDDDARRLIRADRIDLLIDLAGHTARNRLTLLAGRAAPLQAAWLGFSGSTGLPAMDFLIGDSIVTPFADQACCSERIVHLPLYMPPPLGRSPTVSSRGWSLRLWMLQQSGEAGRCLPGGLERNPPISSRFPACSEVWVAG
jgi:predicted O-linked N-acetylglucosamine transferase (SPINDLY family)